MRLIFLTYMLSFVVLYNQKTLAESPVVNVIGPSFVKYSGIPNQGLVDVEHSLLDTKLTVLDKSLYALRYLKTIDLMRARKAYLQLLAALNHDLPRETPNEILQIHGNNPQVKLLINQLQTITNNSLKNRFDRKSYIQARNQSLTSLASLSSLLSLLDAKINFLKLNTNEDHLTKLMAHLLGQKSYIFNKYPILAMVIDGKAFYQYLYADMVNLQYFPQNVIIDANNLGDKLSQYMRESWQRFKVQNLGDNLRQLFTKALVNSLKANTIILKELNASLSIAGASEIFDVIAMNEKSWHQLADAFPYIDRGIFSEGKEQFRRKKINQEKIAGRLSSITSVLGGSSMVVGVILGMAGITALPVLLFSGVGALLFIGQDYFSYVSAKEYKFAAEHLYFAGTSNIDTEILNDFVDIKQDEFESLVLTSMLATVTVAKSIVMSINKLGRILASNLEQASLSTTKGLHHYVRISKVKYVKLKQLSRLIKKKFPAAKKVSSVSKVKNKSTKIKHLNIKKDQALKYLKKTGTPLAVAIENSPIYQTIISTPGLIRNLTRDNLVEISACLIGEYFVRGEKFWDELPFVIMNTIISVGVVTIITFKTAIARKEMWQAWRSENYGTFLKRWSQQAYDLAIPTAKVAILGNTAVEATLHYKYTDPNDPMYMTIEQRMQRVIKTTVFMAAFIGIGSSIRSELVLKNANLIIDRGVHSGLSLAAKNKLNLNFFSELLKVPVSFSNNLIGVMAFTKLARDLGIQVNKEFPPDEMVEYIHYEQNTDNYNYLFSLPQI